ncbi:hypothetical protein PAXRUDRAFT_22341 [Paxillus rubicundulus Ve08.2h10]|uniref:Uncharacterized protein n=1 Tax=Paxillus rubicundulus Ve08.2h10 TaxID=930991 RepID=A0A0D0D5J6_9AGAM|nr:hypothetical protein PAXRUDRAFT_22341 [Paxillus rubicundulus Ve08.2h10]
MSSTISPTGSTSRSPQRSSGKSLLDFPNMPTPQLNWAAMVGDQLLAEQLAYDHGELQ